MVAEGAWWWACCVGVWLLTLSSVSGAEVGVASGSAVPCALAAILARRALRASWRGELRWVAWLPILIAQVALDTARIFGAVAVGRAGRRGSPPKLTPVRVDGRGARGALRQGLAALVVSASPGSLVVDVDRSELSVHFLWRGSPSTAAAVSR